MTNLVKEIVEGIKRTGHTESDIKWVGSYDGEYGMSWEDFKSKFKNITYDSGYGSQEVAVDLVVVGDDWWLERAEYDGAEWWTHKELPSAKRKQLGFDKVLGGRSTIKEIISEEEE